jgi:hypothetical protein
LIKPNMTRKTSFIVLAAVLSLAALTPILMSTVQAKHAEKTTGLKWFEYTTYTCNPPDCSGAFTEKGTAVGTFGDLRFTDNGAETASPDSNGCFPQAITYTFTTHNGDALVLDTPTNVACPSHDPNVYTVKATFEVIGGTGKFADATGHGDLLIAFRVQPQDAIGLFTGTITY